MFNKIKITIEDIREAIKKVEAQTVKSETSDGNCVYRGPDDSKCVFGHLIPDDMYEHWMDCGYCAGELFECDRLTSAELNSIQYLHDNAWMVGLKMEDLCMRPDIKKKLFGE